MMVCAFTAIQRERNFQPPEPALMVSMPSTASTNKPVLRLERAALSLAWAMILVRMDRPMKIETPLKINGINATQGLATKAITKVNKRAKGTSMRVNKVVAV